MSNKKRDILFLCQFFYPEYNSSATLPFDTAKFLASSGFSVGALVGYPTEYTKEKQLPLRETVDDIDIRRIKYLALNRVGKLGRLVNYFSFTFHAFLRLQYLKQYRTVIVYSNPPVLPILPILAKKIYGTKFIFVAYDVYPEVAYASHSVKRGGAIVKVMNYINKHLYNSVDCVVALTDEMKQFLLNNRSGIHKEQITTIANWAHEKESVPDSDAYKRFGYRNQQFVVSYFGNMGTCQDIETMLEAAKLLKEDDRVRFLIIGHGNKKNRVKSFIDKENLKNVQLLDFLTGKDFQKAVAISSCCIVSLEKGLMGTCAPSKYYSYLQGGQPVLAVVEKESYLAKEVEQEKIGHSVMISDGAGLRDAIISLVTHPDECVKMGERARALYANKYSYEIAMKKYEQVMRKVLEQD